MKLTIALAALAAVASSAEANSEEMIDYINSLNTTWTAGHNPHFDGIPFGTVKQMMGAWRETNETRPPYKAEPFLPNDAFPAHFDPRTKWPRCESLRQVRDQGACGSCWAFGAVESMTDRICIASMQKRHVEISAEDLNSCCNDCGDGCDGGYPSAAWRWYENKGLVTGGLYKSHVGCEPYSIASCDHHVVGHLKPCGDVVPTPPCTRQCEHGYRKRYIRDKHYGASTYSIQPVVSLIQKELMTNGPIEAAFTVYADFLVYKSGVYQHRSGAELGGHAVKMMGWGVDNGTPYWLMANSWNDDWGLKGYFKILRGNDECGIEDSLVAGMPKL